MSVKLFDVTLTAATLQGLAINTFYWIDRFGNVTNAGATISQNAATPQPPDQACFDASQYQSAQLYVSHAVLTGAVGGKVSVAEFMPDYGNTAGGPEVCGTTIDQALAATAETLATPIINPPTLQRRAKLALAIMFTTAPTGATPLRLAVWGHRDGQERARG